LYFNLRRYTKAQATLAVCYHYGRAVHVDSITTRVESAYGLIAFKLCSRFQLAPLRHGECEGVAADTVQAALLCRRCVAAS
jgi:hypothetical protein